MLYREFLDRTYFNKQELLASGLGQLVDNPPEGGIACLPAPPFLMFDRITLIEKGDVRPKIIAEQAISPDAWYFQCHFKGDPVQPGCLGVDALWQLLGFYSTTRGAVGSGRALGCKEIEFFGQIRPYDEVVRYELQLRRFMRLKDGGAYLAIADGTVFVDESAIYRVREAKVGIFKDIAYSDFPDPRGRHARGGIIQTSRSSELGG